MKKVVYLGLGLCMALSFASCKSGESAYKKAYEKAKQMELAESQQEPATDVVEVIEQPATVQTPATPVKPAEKVAAPVEKQEKVEVVGNGTLKKYSVVCGSFGLKTNAESLRDYLISEGYNALVVFNSSIAMYRVITSSFDTREEAVTARENFKAKYPNRDDFKASWLLIAQ